MINLDFREYVSNIFSSKVSIYDFDEKLFLPLYVLEKILNDSLSGISLRGMPLRTRSKFLKSKVCEALGYPVPKSFKKTNPRFPSQNFDIFIQKSNNVQIWNDEISEERRYVFVKVSESDEIIKVKAITGLELQHLDNTGTLTKKYQATMISKGQSVLYSEKDTDNVSEYISNVQPILHNVDPNSLPHSKQLLSISEIFKRLLPIVGKSIIRIDAIQERNRGAELHKLICQHLGYNSYNDNGAYPDITNQLIEIKLQTSPTIDLGKHCPNDGIVVVKDHLGKCFKSEDIRYVIFEGSVYKDNFQEKILLKNLYIVTGMDFNIFFPLFKGKVTNSKLQIPLPSNFFD